MGRAEPPSYLRIAADLRKRIANGAWSMGERLPSRAKLADEYGVGPNVLQKAQELLIAEGLLEGRSGSGTYVSRPRMRIQVTRTDYAASSTEPPFRSALQGVGRRDSFESRSTARVPAPERIAARLHIASGDACVCTEYEFLADGRTVQLATSWEPMAITGETPIVLPELGPLAGLGVVARMRHIGLAVTRVRETPRPGRATQELANLLGISVGESLLRIERTHFTADQRPVETADIVVPDLRCEVSYEIQVQP